MNKNTIPINWKTLCAATDDDAAAIQELASIYLEQGAKNVKKLRAAVQRSEPKQVAYVAHRFLGSSRFFGASEIGKPLEALLKMGRSRRLGPAAVRLVDQTDKAFLRIDHFFKSLRERS